MKKFILFMSSLSEDSPIKVDSCYAENREQAITKFQFPPGLNLNEKGHYFCNLSKVLYTVTEEIFG